MLVSETLRLRLSSGISISTLGNQTQAKVQEARPACGSVLSGCTPRRLQFDLIVLVNVMVIIILIVKIVLSMARMIKRPWNPPWKDRIESWGVPGTSFVWKFWIVNLFFHNHDEDDCDDCADTDKERWFSPCRSPSPPARIPFHPWASAFRDPSQIHFRDNISSNGILWRGRGRGVPSLLHYKHPTTSKPPTIYTWTCCVLYEA